VDAPIREELHGAGGAQARHLLRIEASGDGMDDRQLAPEPPMHPEHTRAGGRRSRRFYDVQLPGGADGRCRGGKREDQGRKRNEAGDAHRGMLELLLVVARILGRM
jgi:hypothetical protein